MSKDTGNLSERPSSVHGAAPKKPLIGYIAGTIAGLIVALLTVYLSYTRLKQPQISLDWAALIFSGLTTGIITFFVVWGHFQKPDSEQK